MIKIFHISNKFFITNWNFYYLNFMNNIELQKSVIARNIGKKCNVQKI